MIPVSYPIILSAILFSVGLFGALTRKNAVVMFMSIEIMLNAVNLILIAFALKHNNADGVVMALFVICVAAAEAVIGLALILNMKWKRKTLTTDDFTQLKG